MKKMVWLASYPKSGNTWFRLLLENVLAAPGASKGINEMEKSSMASSRVLMDHFCGVSTAELTDSETEELRPEVYRKYAEQSDDLQFIKVHDAWKRTPSGAALFPEEITKGVIYLIRNPLDIAVSFAHHASKKIDATIEDMNSESFCLCNNSIKKDYQVKQILFDWSTHVTSWIDDSGLPVQVMRYENLLEDTFNTFCKALEFLDLQINIQKIKQAVKASEFNNLKEIESLEGFREKPMRSKSFFREGQAGTWRNILNPSQVEKLVLKHETQMRRFNYLPSNQDN